MKVSIFISKKNLMYLYQQRNINLKKKIRKSSAHLIFHVALKFNYQILITRTYIKKLNYICSISFPLLKSKERTNFEILLEEIKKISRKYYNIEIAQKLFIVIL